jgi:hypothetical protein
MIWGYDSIVFHVLGGIRKDRLDSLRVTIKVELADKIIRHNLDLYNDSQVEKLVRRCSELFEVGTVYIGKSIGELINVLEAYRLEEIKKQADTSRAKPVLSDEQITQATTFLQQPNLLERTNELIGASGVIGEENNRILMYLIFTSRKREQPLHIVSLASSGTGKSYLQEKVSELIPEEDKIETTVLSENAFFYFGQQELKHKLVLIEDLDGVADALYPLRELQSKRRISKTIPVKDSKGQTRTIHLTVEGPVSVAGCTTQESIYEDNANRSFLIYLDESKEQDEQIMHRQRLVSAGKIDLEAEKKIKELLKNCQRILEPIEVRNPFAEHLHIPTDVFKPRRTNTHYLQFIEAITFYKQFQRERRTSLDSTPFIETTLEDIAEANALMKSILLRKSDTLNGACRNYFERLKTYLHTQQQEVFTSREMSLLFRISISTVKRYHLQLTSNGLLVAQEQKKDKSYVYAVSNNEEYDTLQNSVETALDNALERIKQLNGSPSAHRSTELTKAFTGKGNSQQLTKLTQTNKHPKKERKLP